MAELVYSAHYNRNKLIIMIITKEKDYVYVMGYL
jgi:hypothetical protein